MGGDAFRVQLRPTLDKPNSKALFISTSWGNWFKEFYAYGFDDTLPNWVSIHGTYRDNPRADLNDIGSVVQLVKLLPPRIRG